MRSSLWSRMVTITEASGIALISSFAYANTNPASAVPVATDAWKARHESFVREAATGRAQILFLGDSITNMWDSVGLPVWSRDWVSLGAFNFGMGGDRIENVLWRVQNGELRGLSPRVVVLLIGTNNLATNTAQEIVAGHAALVTEIQQRLPESKLLLVSIFPRVDPGSEVLIEARLIANRALSQLSDGKQTLFLDMSTDFLEADGSISKETMSDGLHLTRKGYEIWSQRLIREL